MMLFKVDRYQHYSSQIWPYPAGTVADQVVQLQGLLGGFIERVSFPLDDVCVADVYVNADGAALHLPDNHVASAVLKELGFKLPFALKGHVLLVGEEDTPLTQPALDYLEQVFQRHLKTVQ